MIFAQSSYNYQTRSSNHGHAVQPASCIPFAVRSSAVRLAYFEFQLQAIGIFQPGLASSLV